MNPDLAAAYARLTPDEKSRLSRAASTAIVAELEEMRKEGAYEVGNLEVAKKVRPEANPSAMTATGLGDAINEQAYQIH